MADGSETAATFASIKSGTCRLFIAIACPPLPSIVTLLHDLRALPPEAGLRVVTEDRLHLTLKFIGSIPAELIPRIVAVLEQQLADILPFELRLQGAGSFASVLWLGVDRCQQLAALAAQLNTALQETGFAADTKAFVPHISVAWLKRGFRFDRAAWVSRTGATAWGTVGVDSVCLYESRTLPEGAQYEVLHTVQLNAANALR